MSIKAIVLIRTSTIKQEIESQRAETIAFARSDNFNDEEIKVIGGEGASAIKLDELYRQNMECVYKTIEDNDVNCVYAWAVDRIGRDEEELMKFKKFLIAHKVNLKIKNPTLTLLNDDGTVNNGMEIAFGLYATMAKQEMEQKKARFKRSKERNKKDGKWNGGRMMLGYTVDEDGLLIEHPEDSKIIKDIFWAYAHTPVSTRTLAKEYPYLGFKKTKNLRNQECYIQRILKNVAYIGEGEINYPPIVSKTDFELVQQKLKNYRTLPKVKYKETPYYCQGLIIEESSQLKEVTVNGMLIKRCERHPMRVKKSECSYVSYTEHFSLNINLLDSAILYVVNKYVNAFDTTVIENKIREIREDFKKQIELSETKISDKQNKLDELVERYYGSGTISKATYERTEQRINTDIILLNEELKVLRANASKIKDIDIERVDMYDLDDVKRREMILKYVKVIIAEKLDKYRAEIKVLFQPPIADVHSFIYDRLSKTMEFIYKDKKLGCISIPIVRNIKGRKRIYKGKKYNKSGKQLDEQG